MKTFFKWTAALIFLSLFYGYTDFLLPLEHFVLNAVVICTTCWLLKKG